MISLRNDTGVDYFSDVTIGLASAMVEGAMEIFFEADHIVFDLGLPNEERKSLPDREISAGIALAGGATYMLDLRAGPPDRLSGLPDYIAYEFIDLVGNRDIRSGVIHKTDISAEVTDAMNICFQLGRRAASVAVDGLE